MSIKISELNEATVITTDDLVPLVDDPSGTPVTKKITFSNFVASIITRTGQFDATVGSSGADYSTVKAAIDAGKTSLCVIADTTETADIAVPSGGFTMFIKSGKTVAMGDFQFTFAGVRNVFVYGQGAISYAFTTSKYLFSNSSTSILVLDGITLDNNSTSSYSAISAAIEHFNNIRIELPNTISGGIDASAKSYYSNIELVGGGTSCETAMNLPSDSSLATNIVLSGTFKAGASGDYAIIVGRGSQLSNVFCKHSTNSLAIQVSGTISNLATDVSGQNILLFLSGTSQPKVFGAFLKAGDLDLTSVDNSYVVNLTTTGSITNPGSAASNNVFLDCRVTGALTYGGVNGKFTNCEFLGGVTVPSGANDNGFVNCQMGADAGGGALTITVAAGANRTRIVGCMTDAAISDAGTGTVTAGNTTY